ncbi:helix-turn-helix domain-containing protein [Streptomyces coriariae]|uniref:helix-turn-helix domain-containing protein n=1 Tax=Streptomyces coriariae TaxID=2864460 RepID=UPI001E2D4EC8|nr:helix-turn-helix domain-containing protein [Streptomyces coriariae]
MVLASRVHRLAELRKRQHTTQVQVAEAMGVTQARVSRIEKGQLERSEVDTLAALDSSTVDRLARRHPASRAGRASSSVCSARLTSSPGRSPRKTAGRQRAGRVRRVGAALSRRRPGRRRVRAAPRGVRGRTGCPGNSGRPRSARRSGTRVPVRPVRRTGDCGARRRWPRGPKPPSPRSWILVGASSGQPCSCSVRPSWLMMAPVSR